MSRPLENLIYELSKLPGIGEKSAERILYYILEQDKNEAHSLAEAIVDAAENIEECSICHNYTDDDPCEICTDDTRDKTTICVVESPRDVASMEKTNSYNGLYHVLHGTVRPTSGIFPSDLRFDSLVRRVNEGGIKEVIIATNPTTDGDTTAMYIQEALRDTGVLMTRIAHGIPVGGNLEYYDELTIGTALKNRVNY
ncbi:recombination mediator RecR [Peptoniphilus sp.]|uniref:recombination mediator RecR n=1 Tax=Peptoniphilus sp. TaxID=1971214 RepID=UPI0039960E63